jgi:hypothetical protein
MDSKDMARATDDV